MDVYTGLLDGINQNKSTAVTIPLYLQSLKPHVRFLRKAYFAKPVVVPYEIKEIQDAYLLTYFPHYYQLIYKIFLEEAPNFFKGRKQITVAFIGGGPGSELYGLLKYIANNAADVRQVHVNLFDLNAEAWKHSHTIVESGLLRNTLSENVKLTWQSHVLDMTNTQQLVERKKLLSASDLVVVQNCLNEVAPGVLAQTISNICGVFEWLHPQALLLLSDMTSGAREVMKAIEKTIIERNNLAFQKTTLRSANSGSLISVHHIPSLPIKQNLLTGDDGLIPRKYVKYDYTVLGKSYDGQEVEEVSPGFNALYGPLNFAHLDVNNHTSTKIFIGIDFGTSTTVISGAVVKDGNLMIEPIALPQKDKYGTQRLDRLVPAVVSKVGNQVMVGYYAAQQKSELRYGVDCWHSFKANLGNLDDITYPQSVLKNHPKLRIANMKDAMGAFLSYLHRELNKWIIENFPDREPMYALSIPVGFGSAEKRQLKERMAVAGFECLDVPFIEEPNAALVHYFFASNSSLPLEKPLKVMVLDLGAGTVDFSVMEIEKKEGEITSKILAVHRDGKQGGNWIDARIAEKIIDKYELNSELEPVQQVSLVSACEQLKLLICKMVITDKSVSYVLQEAAMGELQMSLPGFFETRSGKKILVGLTYQEFYGIMLEYWSGSHSFSGIKASIDSCFSTATLQKENIDKVIITGGGGRNPYLKSFLAKYLGAQKLYVADDIQEQVARGTALHSFVVNSFGKPIITSLLNEDIFVGIDGKRQKLFSRGDGYPTHDVDVFFMQQKLSAFQIPVYTSRDAQVLKIFAVPEPSKVKQLVFFVDPDQELRCEIITDSEASTAQEIFSSVTNKLTI